MIRQATSSRRSAPSFPTLLTRCDTGRMRSRYQGHRSHRRRAACGRDEQPSVCNLRPLRLLTNFVVNGIDRKICQCGSDMLDIEVIDQASVATAALEPVRSQLLAELREPASAATLATRLGLKRQKINYHLHALEEHGLVQIADTRKWGGLTERLMVASAKTYVVSTSALGPVGADPDRTADRLSASYLIALGARLVREIGALQRAATDAGKSLATLAIDTEIRFRSAADRASFTRELTEAVTTLAARYHDETAPQGRSHRLVVTAHPSPANPQER